MDRPYKMPKAFVGRERVGSLTLCSHVTEIESLILLTIHPEGGIVIRPYREGGTPPWLYIGQGRKAAASLGASACTRS